MIQFLFRTTWQHIRWVPWTSLIVVCVFSVFFLTWYGCSRLYTMFLHEQSKINTDLHYYNIPLLSEYTLDDPRILEFIDRVGHIGVTQVEIQTKEEILDREIAKNPEIVKVFDGVNPFSDVIRVPLNNVDIDGLWTSINEYADVIDFFWDKIEFRKRLLRYEKALSENRNIWTVIILSWVLISFLFCTVIITTIRYHLSKYSDERVVGKILGAKLVYIWWPYVLAMILYLCTSFLLFYGALNVLKRMFD